MFSRTDSKNNRIPAPVTGRAVAQSLLMVLALSFVCREAYATKPNFVVVMTDDMRLDQMTALPNVKSLIGGHGITFDQAFVNDPLCAPSRATFFTGEYAHNHGIVTNVEPYDRLRQQENKTLAVWLHDAGWKTALIGKYSNLYLKGNAAHVPLGWDRWFVEVNNFQDSRYWSVSDQGVTVQEGNKYTTDVLLGKAVQFIRANPSRPIFLDFAVSPPHEPCPAAARDADKFPAAGVPRTPAFNEADVSDKPSFMQFPALDPASVQSADAHYAQCLRSLASVDSAVATLVATLRDVGRLASTYFIFTSDHGYHYGEHRLPFGKQSAYETDLHVPLMIRGPGVHGPTSDNHLIVNADLAPTILALASLPAQSLVNGRTFHRLLRAQEPSQSWRQAFPFEHTHSDTEDSAPWPDFRGVRTAHYAWTEWANGQRELYDLRADPFELTNLAGTVGLDDVRSRLADLTARLAICAGANCQTIEREAAP